MFSSRPKTVHGKKNRNAIGIPIQRTAMTKLPPQRSQRAIFSTPLQNADTIRTSTHAAPDPRLTTHSFRASTSKRTPSIEPVLLFQKEPLMKQFVRFQIGLPKLQPTPNNTLRQITPLLTLRKIPQTNRESIIKPNPLLSHTCLHGKEVRALPARLSMETNRFG